MSKRAAVPNLKTPGLPEAIAAYQRLMDEVVTESQHGQGKREDVDRVAYLGDIIERGAARSRAARR